jgi:hypothetical protein
MGIGKLDNNNIIIPNGSNNNGCGDNVKVNCSGSACNSQNAK